MFNDLSDTDYLTETLATEEQARKEIFLQMLCQLELIGKCRSVYHRLAYVLFDDTLGYPTGIETRDK